MLNAAPIALFAFNRPDLLARTLTALAANELATSSALTIFCDGPRHEGDEAGTRAVRALARSVTGFARLEVVERPHNMGCAASIIDGLTEMFRRHERLIVIEDDNVTSPHTLRFLNEGLARYADNEHVFNISAWTPPNIARKLPSDYPYDAYAIPRFNCSGGWASWSDRFLDIDWDVKDYQTFKASPQRRKAFNAGGEDLSAMLDARWKESSMPGTYGPIMPASPERCWASILCALTRSTSAWAAARTPPRRPPAGTATYRVRPLSRSCRIRLPSTGASTNSI